WAARARASTAGGGKAARCIGRIAVKRAAWHRQLAPQVAEREARHGPAGEMGNEAGGESPTQTDDMVPQIDVTAQAGAVDGDEAGRAALLARIAQRYSVRTRQVTVGDLHLP